MAIPKRGDVWRVKWRHKQGTELGAGKQDDERACLVVSHDRFYVDKNGDASDRLTVVPFTRYKPRREVMRSLWSVIITNQYDIDPGPDSENMSEQDQLDRWVMRRDRSLVYDSKGNGIPGQSIIDCGQITTIWARQPPDPDNDDLRWNCHYGTLKDEVMLRVDFALQNVIGGGARSGQKLIIQEGQVLNLRLPERKQELNQRCLVVSSAGLDAVRESLEVEFDGDKRPLRHCTVVPLEPEGQYQNKHGLADVLVDPVDAHKEAQIETAVCLEIYTVDWWERDAGVVGHVPDDLMDTVRLELRKYLGLPR